MALQTSPACFRTRKSTGSGYFLSAGEGEQGRRRGCLVLFALHSNAGRAIHAVSEGKAGTAHPTCLTPIESAFGGLGEVFHKGEDYDARLHCGQSLPHGRGSEKGRHETRRIRVDHALEPDLLRVEMVIGKPDVELHVGQDVAAQQGVAVVIGIGVAGRRNQPLLIDVES